MCAWCTQKRRLHDVSVNSFLKAFKQARDQVSELVYWKTGILFFNFLFSVLTTIFDEFSTSFFSMRVVRHCCRCHRCHRCRAHVLLLLPTRLRARFIASKSILTLKLTLLLARQTNKYNRVLMSTPLLHYYLLNVCVCVSVC